MDYGARWYDGAVGRWGSVDPLTEKYSMLSSYNYVANNPIKLFDSDGKQIIVGIVDAETNKKTQVYYQEGKYYKEGTTEEYTTKNVFLNEVKSSIEYLSNSETAGALISEVGNSTEINVTIKEISHMEIGNENGNIEWNPVSGLQFKIDGKWQEQTPALGLLHELCHTYFEQNKDKLGGGDPDKWIIDKVETPVAKDLGEGARTSHGQGQTYATKGPTTTEKETKESRNARKEAKKAEKNRD